MLQNSLASLSTAQIQQLLDELSFREAFGYFPLMCFESLLQKAAEQTRSALDMGASIAARLKVTSERVNLESYFYATLQGDMQVRPDSKPQLKLSFFSKYCSSF